VSLIVIHCNNLRVTVLRMYKEPALLSLLMTVCMFLVITEVTLMLFWFYRAAAILCSFCLVHPVTQMQHLMVCVILAIQKLRTT